MPFWAWTIRTRTCAPPRTRRWSACRRPARTATTSARETAKLLSEGHVFGWFQGRSEFGPRALGNRSILADPRKAEMKDMLNKRVKHRQAFRPFAPIVLAERADEIFEGERGISRSCCWPSACARNGATGSRRSFTSTAPRACRPCGRNTNERLYRLLKEFDALTGVPVLINTSFNVKGEPIVETPEDALNCFLDHRHRLSGPARHADRKEPVPQNAVSDHQDLFGNQCARPHRLDCRDARLTANGGKAHCPRSLLRRDHRRPGVFHSAGGQAPSPPNQDEHPELCPAARLFQDSDGRHARAARRAQGRRAEGDQAGIWASGRKHIREGFLRPDQGEARSETIFRATEEEADCHHRLRNRCLRSSVLPRPSRILATRSTSWRS